MQKYIDLLTKTKEASGVSQLCQSSPNSNLGELVTMRQRRKNTEKCRFKKQIIKI